MFDVEPPVLMRLAQMGTIWGNSPAPRPWMGLAQDTCATNFMIRDEKMKALVAPDKEPITAFVRNLVAEKL